MYSACDGKAGESCGGLQVRDFPTSLRSFLFQIVLTSEAL